MSRFLVGPSPKLTPSAFVGWTHAQGCDSFSWAKIVTSKHQFESHGRYRATTCDNHHHWKEKNMPVPRSKNTQPSLKGELSGCREGAVLHMSRFDIWAQVAVVHHHWAAVAFLKTCSPPNVLAQRWEVTMSGTGICE